ncbi:outer membrane protein [Fulvimarina manganoxydans]|uniref:Outer membrane protein n=1 Tax=Fulvimarina manganoxydans TaxID=937218 RepID=A0A1W2DF16_9HYPH|nr:OmpW family outer membrane protein [Fulvimarina manganoxydans]SMC95596.1 outer membrane protein [Fulvimarina manganoxydans]
MRKSAVQTAVVATSMMMIGAAQAADTLEIADQRVAEAHDWYVNIGLAGVLFDSSSKIDVMGHRVPDADAEISDEMTGTAEIGYYVRPDVSLALTLGIPLTSDFDGRGSFEGLRLGEVTYGTVMSTAKYHINAFGEGFRPYIGAGVAYTFIFDDKDAVLKDFEVEGEFGAVLQAGAEFGFWDNYHLFTDVKKVFTGASGTATTFDPATGAPLPATAKVDLDPLVLTAGVGMRF